MAQVRVPTGQVGFWRNIDVLEAVPVTDIRQDAPQHHRQLDAIERARGARKGLR
jgi:hypothetical protein